MDVEALYASYCRDGYAIIEDAVSPTSLAAAQRAYEATIVAAIKEQRPGAADFESPSPTAGTYRFQDPHHPRIVQPDLVAAMSGPRLMSFVERLCGPRHCLHGIAAFSMGGEFDYRGPWHRDSYAAWGKDSEQELKLRTVPTADFSGTQVLLALHDDACFTFIPASQVCAYQMTTNDCILWKRRKQARRNLLIDAYALCVCQDRPNTETEERLLTPTGESTLRPGWAPTDTVFPGQVTLKVRAGTAVPFDARGIHRGLKPKGPDRKSLFVVCQLKLFALAFSSNGPFYWPSFLLSSPRSHRPRTACLCMVNWFKNWRCNIMIIEGCRCMV
jgi:hypothetical protein